MKQPDTLKALRIINACIAVLLLNMFLTALFNDWIDSDVYEVVHIYPGILLGVFMIGHLYFNRAWIKKQYFSKRK